MRPSTEEQSMSDVEGAAANPVIRKEIRDTHDERDRRLVADTLAVLSTPTGQRFLAYLLEDCGLLRTNFVEDPRRSAFNEGRRSVASQLCGVIMACDVKYWRAVEDAMIARRIPPTNKIKETDNE